MGGKELNNSFELRPHRWAINFGEMSKSEALKYKDPFIYIQHKLQKKRSKLDEKYARIINEWWKYFHSRIQLFGNIKKLNLKKVLARSRVSDLHMIGFIDSDIIFTDALIVFLYDTHAHFALLQSTIHDVWSRAYASTMKTDVRYIVTDCFETFPFPENIDVLESHGKIYDSKRLEILKKEQIGLTKLYNKFHNPEGVYFVSFAVVEWIDVFTRTEYKNIFLDTLRYAQRNKGIVRQTGASSV